MFASARILAIGASALNGYVVALFARPNELLCHTAHQHCRVRYLQVSDGIVEPEAFKQKAALVSSITDAANDPQKIQSDSWLVVMEFLTNAVK